MCSYLRRLYVRLFVCLFVQLVVRNDLGFKGDTRSDMVLGVKGQRSQAQ